MPLVYDDIRNAWRFPPEEHLCVKSGCLVHPGTDAAVAVAFTAPEAGVYAVRRRLSPAPYLDKFGARVVCSVFRGKTPAAEVSFAIGRETSEEQSFETPLKEGERLYFEVRAEKSNAHCFVSDEIELRIKR